MPSGAVLADHRADVVELAKYRRVPARLVSDVAFRNEYRDSLVHFAEYLRERTTGIAESSYGLERLAVGLDMRRIRLMETLSSMVSADNHLSDEVRRALSLFGCLASELALPIPNSCSVAEVADELACGLDVLVSALDVKASSSHLTVQ